MSEHLAHFVQELKVLGLQVCAWDKGSAGDFCHEPESSGYRPLTVAEVVAVVDGDARVDAWGRVVR